MPHNEYYVKDLNQSFVNELALELRQFQSLHNTRAVIETNSIRQHSMEETFIIVPYFSLATFTQKQFQNSVQKALASWSQKNGFINPELTIEEGYFDAQANKGKLSMKIHGLTYRYLETLNVEVKIDSHF